MDIANLIIRVTNEGLDSATRELNRLRTEAGQTAEANKKLGKAIQTAGKYAAVGVGALTATVAGSVKTAMSFESSMAEINKTADFTSANGLNNLKEELKDLTKVMPLAFEELADIAASGGQAGIAGEELGKFTETIAKMGIAFDISAGQASESMGMIASAYKIPITEIADLGDAINEVSNNSGATADKVIDFMLRVGVASDNLNIAAEAAGAMGAALIDAGVGTEVAGTAVSKMMLEMSNPAWLESNADIFKGMGINVQEYAELVKTDGLAAFNLLRDGVMASDDPMTNLTELFKMQAIHVKKLFEEGTRLEPLLDSVGQGAEGAATHLGSLNREYEIMADTSENAFVLLSNSMRLVYNAIGEAFLPIVKELTDAVMPLIQKFAGWVELNPELVKQIVIVSGAVLGSVVAIAGLATAVGNAIAIFENLKTAFDLAKIGLSAFSGPIGIAVLAIGALIAVGVLLYQNWDLVKEKATELNEWIKSKFGSLPEPLQQAGRDIAAIFMGIFNAGKEYLGFLKDVYSGTFESFKTIAVGAFEVVWSVIKASFSGILNTVSASLQIIATLFSGGFALLKNTVTTVMDIIKAVIAGDFKAIPKIMGDGLSAAISIVGGIIENILNIFKNAGAKLYNIGRDFISGFVNGIKSMAGGAVSAASTMVGNTIEAVRKRQNSNSDSKVTTALGKDFGNGFKTGIKSKTKAVVSEAQKMVDAAIKKVKDGIKSLNKEIALFGNDDPLAEFNYDEKMGEYNGVSNKDKELFKSSTLMLDSLKEQKKASDELANANQSVENSIEGIRKQIDLFGDTSSLSSLIWDIENTDKYKKVSDDIIDRLKNETAALEQKQNALKATNAIQKRMDEWEKEKETRKDNLIGVLDGLQESTPMGKLIADYENNMAVLQEYEESHTEMVRASELARYAIEKDFADKRRDLMLSQAESMFGGLADLSKSMLGEQSKTYKVLFGIQKSFAIASAGIAMYETISQAMKVGFPKNLALMAKAATQGAGLISSIRSINAPIGQAHDGIMSVPKSGTWNLEKGERVLPQQTARAMDKKLAEKNNAGNVTVNVTVQTNGDSETTVQGANQFGSELATIIKRVTQDTIRKEQRQGGLLHG